MIIYEKEKQDGLEELLLSKASVNFDSEIKPKDQVSKALERNNSKDLFGIESILVSVGWNKNDDIFDPKELWKARATPINKKFNYMHDEKDIIGHITRAFVLDGDGNIIPDDTKEEELPEFFEIGVDSVMYSIWEDKDLQERAATLMHEIAEGKWFVSMEVYFPDFDYALSKGEEHRIIERNEETSFLTKHLRVYNGKGEYEGWKVGRKLKDMFFSGKGLVNNPANKRSLITSFNFNGAKASTSIFDEVKMSDIKREDHEKVVAELGVAKNSLDSVNKEKDLLSEKVETLKGDVEGAKALNADLQKRIDELTEANSVKEQKLAEANKALADVLAQIKNTERVSQLVDAGVEKSEAERIVEKFASASDEMFEEVVKFNKVEKTEKSSAKEASEKLDKTEADEKDHITQETEVDETEKLLEASVAFIRKSLNKDKGGE